MRLLYLLRCRFLQKSNVLAVVLPLLLKLPPQLMQFFGYVANLDVVVFFRVHSILLA